MSIDSTSTAKPMESAALAFGQSRVARFLGSALRGVDRVAPHLAARLALHLFFAPIPSRLGARKRLAAHWQVERVSLLGGSIAVLRLRSARSGERPRVLLVHGWAGNALQMQAMGEAIAEAGFEPILFDLPAHGRSDGWRCTMPQIVESLFAIEVQVGSLAAVVAHSMGGVASLHAVARGLAAERLVVMAPSSTPASVLRWFGQVFSLSEGLILRMRERIVHHEGMALEEFEPGWLTSRLYKPVLIIHDRGDRMAPVSNGQALARALLNSRLQITEGLSHRRVLSDPQVIQAVVAHLTEKA
jgi:pimeloyl-ACP methyl ester carboxylesterase